MKREIIKRMGHICHRPFVEGPKRNSVKPRYAIQSQNRKLFYEKRVDDRTKKYMKRYTKHIITLYTPFGDTIEFTKTSLGQSYKDPRSKDGKIDQREFEAEINRILGPELSKQLLTEISTEE